LEPVFSSFGENVAEAVRERGGPAFQLAEDALDAIPISVVFRMKSEASSAKCSLEMLCTIDEKHGSFDIVFLTELTEENLGRYGGCRGKQPDVKQVIRFGIGGGIQPVLLGVNPNHRLVKRNVIRTSTLSGL
jgi:hypothetical protein